MRYAVIEVVDGLLSCRLYVYVSEREVNGTEMDSHGHLCRNLRLRMSFRRYLPPLDYYLRNYGSENSFSGQR